MHSISRPWSHGYRKSVRIYIDRAAANSLQQPLRQQAYKPGSVLTAIYLAPQLLAGSSRLLETVGQTYCFSTALLRNRVYSVKPMLPWAGWALTPPFHPYLAAVYFCCTCPEVTLGGRYPLFLPCGARTFLIRGLSACVRGCPAWSRKYCTPRWGKCQMSCKFFLKRLYYSKLTIDNGKLKIVIFFLY